MNPPPHLRARRLARVPHLLVAVAVTGAATATFLAGVTPADAATAAYVRAVPVCAPVRAARATCSAMKLVPSRQGEPGARPATEVAKAAGATGPAGGYSPTALATAYGVSRTTATTQVVGIVDAHDDPNVLTDLNAFDAHYGFPAETSSTFRVVNQRGVVGQPPSADSGWAGEISLDVDAVRGLCASCRIVLVEADTASFADLAVAENQAVTLGATIVTNSYGGPESGPPPAAVTSAYNHPGVVITASTGDAGFYDWDQFNQGGSSSNAPELPAAFPTVVAVGGTTLDLDSAGNRSVEQVWNSDGPYDYYGNQLRRSLGASGGGCSTLFTAPAWQSAVANYAKTGCGSKRMVGDIAAVADPFTGFDVYDTYQAPGWQTFGGTSLASPLVAAVWALAGGARAVDYPAKTLYANAAGKKGYDVRVGGNGACGGASTTSCAAYFQGSPNLLGHGVLDCSWRPAPSTALVAQNSQCNAKVGYDGPSGVGTPKGLALFTP